MLKIKKNYKTCEAEDHKYCNGYSITLEGERFEFAYERKLTVLDIITY